MTDPSGVGTQSQQAGATRAQDPPVMVASTVGDVTAVWQVEVDARVLLGDFSGAWLVDSDGVHGFAAGADWIGTVSETCTLTVPRATRSRARRK